MFTNSLDPVVRRSREFVCLQELNKCHGGRSIILSREAPDLKMPWEHGRLQLELIKMKEKVKRESNMQLLTTFGHYEGRKVMYDMCRENPTLPTNICTSSPVGPPPRPFDRLLLSDQHGPELNRLHHRDSQPQGIPHLPRQQPDPSTGKLDTDFGDLLLSILPSPQSIGPKAEATFQGARSIRGHDHVRAPAYGGIDFASEARCRIHSQSNSSLSATSRTRAQQHIFAAPGNSFSSETTNFGPIPSGSTPTPDLLYSDDDHCIHLTAPQLHPSIPPIPLPPQHLNVEQDRKPGNGHDSVIHGIDSGEGGTKHGRDDGGGVGLMLEVPQGTVNARGRSRRGKRREGRRRGQPQVTKVMN
ncbi:hypothetical protein BDK51DRAFT_42233 [Blyttiomyces helicus]|uniref:Uncharacterized protein n=1 Tax=Blyttiomyces helicus TaxID=388810 RepID=A0A4P9WLQ3_9FUNG|nr:hypothetical protein BDK51DRAFT_42233 [Blyttiomyces helicus]|eukprot:RKO93352.1 hypothetical protein BDK51DRAFT_42233 [Blyttiomyces helicus]